LSAPLTIAYVLTTDGRDQFADMALVSMLSVRISNPGCRILLLCDAESGIAIKSAKHRVLEVCDEVIFVETPGGNPTFRNRWIKTQLSRFCPFDCLYLDADTLVRDSLFDIPQKSKDFAAIPNHNQANVNLQVEAVEREYMQAMGWETPSEKFYNGGVWFYRFNPETNEFFRLWHKFWCEGHKKTQQFRDQPSLNVALGMSGVQTTTLPNEYNWQMFRNWSGFQAKVWHFYSSASMDGSIFAHLLELSTRFKSLQTLQSHIRKAIKSEHAWKNNDFISNLVLSRRSQVLKNYEILWLEKRRLASIRLLTGQMREYICK
jgi:hypothetical protein